MSVRVETDTVIYVPAKEPGSEDPHDVEIRFSSGDDGIVLDRPREGRSEVKIEDMEEALQRAKAGLDASGPVSREVLT